MYVGESENLDDLEFLDTEEQNPKPLAPTCIFVHVRFLRHEIPAFDPAQADRQAYDAAVEDWHRLWEIGAPPVHAASDVLASPTRRLPRAEAPLGSPSAGPHFIFRKLTAAKRALLDAHNDEQVRTPLAHWLEDYARLSWAASTGLPVYALDYIYNLDRSRSPSVWAESTSDNKDPGTHWYLRFGYQDHKRNWLYASLLCLNTTKPPALMARAVPTIFYAGMSGTVTPKCSLSGTGEFPDDGKADSYYETNWFILNAGRDSRTVSLSNVPNMLMAYWLAGRGRLFLKSTSSKHGIWPVTLPSSDAADITPGRLMGMLLDSFPDGRLLRAPDSGEPQFIVQDFIQFADEYRCFVVDGRLAGGTPVRRADTQHAWRLTGKREGRFRPFMCADREADGPRHERARTAAYARAARRLVAAVSAEGGNVPSDYVLDLGTDVATGKIIPVEMNGLSAAGLYGFPVERYLEAGLRAARKRALKRSVYRAVTR